MTVTCGLWAEDITPLGDFEFASVPRAGDKISIPNDAGDPFTHYTVIRVVHRATGTEMPCATFLFVESE